MHTIRKGLIGAGLILSVISLALPALAGSRIEKELRLEPGGKLRLDTEAGSVKVTGSERAGARVVITSSQDGLESLYDFKFEEREGEVEITAQKKGEGRGWFGSLFSWSWKGSAEFAIEVPRRTAVDVDTSGGSIEVRSIDRDSRLDTSGGSIRVSDLHGNLQADTSGGSIVIENVQGNINGDTSGGSISVNDVRGDVAVETSGGSIQIAGVTGDLSAETSGGSIRISEAGGRVVAETSGGSIEAALTPGNERGGSLSSSGGGVRVTIDRTANLDIDASSSGGSVSFDVPVATTGEASKTSLRGKMGGGGEKLVLRSSGGPVRIQAL